MKVVFFGVVVVASCVFAGCGGTTQSGASTQVRGSQLDVALQSERDSARSHNVGENCMRCHQANGQGLGRFTLAGTLRNPDGTPHPNGSVTLARTLPGEQHASRNETDTVIEVHADAKGNFYTTATLPLPDEPLFAIVRSADGSSQNAMGWKTMTAACNACHVGSNVLSVEAEHEHHGH